MKMIAVVQERIASYRAVMHLIVQNSFVEIYDRTAEGDRKVLDQLIESGQVEKLRDWYRLQWNNNKLIGEKTVVELRKIAQRLGIADYFKLPKAQLLGEIDRCQKKKSAS